MANTNETIADIIAEKRRQAEHIRNNLSTVPFRQWDQQAEIKLLEDEADRLEAAHKRELPQRDPDWAEICTKCHDGESPEDCEYFGEPNGCNSPIYGQHPNAKPCGNSAALREALEACIEAMCRYCRMEAGRDRVCVHGCETLKMANAALAAPPRNCDRFADETDAQIAFLNEVWLISVTKETALESEKFDNWTDEMRYRYAKWLFAPATEKEGGNDGNE